MKKKYIYLITVVVFLAAITFIYAKYKRDIYAKEATVYQLQNRQGATAQSPEWASLKNNASILAESIRRNPEDIKSLLGLASLFIQEARVTGNYMYYDMAAIKYINTVLKKDSLNFNALMYKSMIYLSQHHFADGLAMAEKAQKINPYNAFVYGIIIDGNVEMGNYPAAVENSDKMVSIRPDLRSYSRISYLREIHGDYPGAIDAMKMAVEAGAPGDESTEWCRIQLGHLYENTGDMKYAEMHYTIAAQQRPTYAYAYAGLARISRGKKDYPQALALTLKADSMISENAFKEQLVELYKLTGQTAKSAELSTQMISSMSQDAVKGNTDESIGHYADRELAYAYLDVNNFDKALEHAETEYNRRPDNIDVNETLAWVYYKRGEFAKAVPLIKTALRTNSKNPVLLSRAGLIYNSSGDKVMAKKCLSEAFAHQPNMSPLIRQEAEKTLATL